MQSCWILYILSKLAVLKEYSMILTTSFYDDVNQKIQIKKKSLFPKCQLIPVLRLQVMHDYVHWHCSIDHCVKLSLVDEPLCKKLLSFHKENMISA